jgi:hypothetical protein
MAFVIGLEMHLSAFYGQIPPCMRDMITSVPDSDRTTSITPINRRTLHERSADTKR